MIKAQTSHAQQTCAWCVGTGKWAVSMGYVVSCLVCGGKGKVTVAEPSGPCRHCEGLGRRSPTAPCLTCAGTGWERVFEQL